MSAPELYACTKCGGATYACSCDSFRHCTKPLFAAPPQTQQGEPVAWMFKVWDGRKLSEFAAIDYEPQHHNVFGWEEIRDKQPLYTAPPTCFSAADMADAQAKAAQVEREECARTVATEMIPENDVGCAEDNAYNKAIRDAVKAIRSRGFIACPVE